ncbi:MarR family winged helix-turn-helix transcriptional regulator [Saccharothrix deserti]|uniref:MarR family winged helix-turn-helix transcriptional regulator n=1 Tax=Saccharothrix deserti TaxID=2593674 RepID=UPI00131BF9F3|nr:MarR family transcriptional regulator [Saccharothrix deserti]
MDETPGWLTPTEQHAWRSFLRMQEKLAARLGRELLADSKLSTPDYGVLVELTDAPDGRRRLQDLAGALEREQSRMSHHVARMVKRGLVVREECAGDGRGVLVAITPAGREAIEAAAPQHVSAVRRLFIDRLTPEELDTLARISDRIVAALEREPGRADPPPGGPAAPRAGGRSRHAPRPKP